MDQERDPVLPAAPEDASGDELSDLDVDGSSSLSEIQDRDEEQEDNEEDSDVLSRASDDDDSEAETERLEESPNKFRPNRNVVLGVESDNQTYERSPSKLNNQITAEDVEDEDDEDPLSEEEASVNESPKSSPRNDGELEPPTAATSLEDSSVEGKKSLSVSEAENRKRKRSIMAGSGLDADPDEPLRKRTGSVAREVDDYAIDDDDAPDEIGDTSNPVSGNISGDEGAEEDAQDDEVTEDIEQPDVVEDDDPDVEQTPVSPKRRGRQKGIDIENGIEDQEEDLEDAQADDVALNGDEEKNADEDNAENEGDDAPEAALRNEEERE